MNQYKILFYLIFPAACMQIGCSNKLDNYEPPRASLSGAIIDIRTNDTVPMASSIGQGGILNLFQLNYSSTASGAIGSNFLNNGTYKNASIFSGTYKVAPSGPFYADTIIATVNGDTKLDLKVRPWIYVTLKTGNVTDTSATFTYSIKSNDAAQQIAQGGAFLNTASVVDVQEFLGVNNGDTRYRNIQPVNGDTTITVVFTGLAPNTTYYIRAGSSTATSSINPQNYYNYSKIYAIKTAGK